MKIGNYTIELDAWQDWTSLREWPGFNFIALYLSLDTLEVALLGFGLDIEFYNTAERQAYLDEVEELLETHLSTEEEHEPN